MTAILSLYSSALIANNVAASYRNDLQKYSIIYKI